MKYSDFWEQTEQEKQQPSGFFQDLSKPTSGEVIVAGFDAYRQPEKIKKNIGYMCQKFSLYEDLTVKENIILYGGIYGMSKSLIKERTD